MAQCYSQETKLALGSVAAAILSKAGHSQADTLALPLRTINKVVPRVALCSVSHLKVEAQAAMHVH